MATTYLELTNEILREINEVPLNLDSFEDARGIQVHVKNSINRAYMDIVNSETQWPFLSATVSGSSVYSPQDDMYGNINVTVNKGERWHYLKQPYTGIQAAYLSVDWDNFYITTEGVTGADTPYMGSNLRYTTLEEWKDFARVSENLDNAGNKVYGQPSRVIRSADSLQFGLSPIPDKEYKVWFFAYVQPTKLSLHNDILVFPDMYASVLSARARYYVWQFKDSAQAAAFALDDYKKGLKRMRSNLMEPAPTYFKDDRVRYI